MYANAQTGAGDPVVMSTAASGTPAGVAKKVGRQLSFERLRPGSSASSTGKKVGRQLSFERLRRRSSGSSSGPGGDFSEDSLGSVHVLQIAITGNGDYLAALVQPVTARPSTSTSTHDALLSISSAQQPVAAPKFVIVYANSGGDFLEPLVNRHFKDGEGAPLPLAPFALIPSHNLTHATFSLCAQARLLACG